MEHIAGRGSILLADDDDAVRRLLERTLTGEGFSVRTAAAGDEALRTFEQHAFDVLVSDIDMPGMSGIEFLKAVRARDLDVPVLLITGGPQLESAISAIEYGAYKYLTKPLDLPRLLEAVHKAIHAGRLARARRSLINFGGNDAKQVSDLAGLGASFDRALKQLYLVHQPIVRWSARSVFAYEALVRSEESTLRSPEALLDAAERLGRTIEVGTHVRALSAVSTTGGGETLRFINLHPEDLTDESLYDPKSPLADFATHTVLEITERARLETVHDVFGRVSRLRDIGFRIALDDIGAGYAGLTSFAALEPEFVKLDRALVENIGQSNTKKKLVMAMIEVCADLGVQVIGEGVETESEREALVDIGCDLLQGYLFARPERQFVQPRF